MSTKNTDSFMFSKNKDGSTCSFKIYIHFVYFPCLITMIRTSKTMLGKSYESNYPDLVPHLSAIVFSLLSLRIIY